MKEDQLEYLRSLKIKLAHLDFWEYCRLDDPDFFSEKHVYLKKFAQLLQAFYERKIYRDHIGDRENNFGWLVGGTGKETCTRLIVNMPPRHGKTRTVSLFESWLLGKDPNERIIAGSYNDNAASDISRLVRDKITEVSKVKWKVVFRDVFPGVGIKVGDSSISRWALEGKYFNYLAAGVGGSATGKGCTLLVIDDPVKNADQAYSTNAMIGVRSWINDTMLSRMEGDALFFIVMTRWPGCDPVEEYMESENANMYYQLSMPAHLGNGRMLNSDILNYPTYLSRKNDTDETIFSANYDQQIITPRNALYKEFRTYEYLPLGPDGLEAYDAKVAYTDTADGGADYTCAIAATEYKKELFVTGIVYTRGEASEVEPEVAVMLRDSDTREACFESNSGGKAFAKGVENYLRVVLNNAKVNVEWIHQSANKESRILTNALNVQKRVIYPLDWKERWPEYARGMQTFLRVGRNKNDDAPDATTGLVEFSDNRGVILL